MPQNKYKGNSSAYGIGKYLQMNEGFDDRFTGPANLNTPDDWTLRHQATPDQFNQNIPRNTGWLAESEALRKGDQSFAPVSAQQNPNSSIIGANAADTARAALTSSSPAPTMPTLGDSLGSPVNNTSATNFGPVTASVGPVSPPRLKQAPMDQRRRYEYNAPNTAAGSGGTYSLPGVSVTPDEKPWYGSLPNTEGMQAVKPMQVEANLNWSQQMANTQRAQSMGRKLAKERDAAGRNISGEGSYYHAGVHSRKNAAPSGQPGSSDYDPIQAGDLATTMGGADNLANYGTSENLNQSYSPRWGKEKVELDKFASYDSGKRFSNEEVAENLAEVTRGRRDEWTKLVQDEYGVPTEGSPLRSSMDQDMYYQALEGPDTSKEMYAQKETADDWFRDQDMPELNMDEIMAGKDPQVTDMEQSFDAGRDPTNAEISKRFAPKLGEKISKGLATVEKAAPYIAAGANVLSTVSQMDQRSDIIGDLRGSVSKVEGMIGNMANQEHAEAEAMADEYAEGNRRIGEGQNLQLGNRLDSVKGSNLNTGSIKRIKEDLTDDFHRTTDLSLASAATDFEKKTEQFHADNRDTRAKATEELKQLRAELKEQERQQKMAPFSLAADLAIGVVGASNPLLGMGLSAMKNKAFS